VYHGVGEFDSRADLFLFIDDLSFLLEDVGGNKLKDVT